MLRICYSVNGAKVTLLTSGICKHMKRAATICLREKTKITLSFKIIELLLWFKTNEKTPWQDRGAKTRPQGQLECANPLGSPGGDGQAWNWLIHNEIVSQSSHNLDLIWNLNPLELNNSELMYQSIPSLTIPLGNFFDGRISHPLGKKSSKPPPPGPIKTS